MPYGILVNVSCKELKSLSKWALKGRWGKAIMASVLSLLVVNIPPIILGAIIGPEKWANVVDVYSMLVSAPMMLGLTMVFLNIFRKRETGPMEVFYGFEFLLKAVVLQIWMSLLIFFQTLCFIIPGLIASLRYSLAFFILADDPRKRPMQCITESKFLMMGNKMSMFKLVLSFFGWYFLAALPMGVVMNFFPTENYLMYELMILLTGLVPCILEPYVQVTLAAFYEIANGNLRVKRTNTYEAPDTNQNMDYNEANRSEQNYNVQDVEYKTVETNDNQTETDRNDEINQE